MFIFKRLWCLLLLALLLSNPAYSCSLPAEPCAAIVPLDSKTSGMILVEEGNTFFYLVPQGKGAAFKLVWDPASHNSSSLQKDKYDWCIKAKIGFQPGADKPNGYGYFPATAMKDFFQLSGKGKVVEAFTRQTGISTGDAFVAGDLGPYLTLSTFAKPGQESEVSTIGGTANAYPDNGLFPLAGLSDEPVEPSIDLAFPNSLKNKNPVPITYEGTKKNLYQLDDNTAIEIMGEGLLIEDINIELTNIEVSDYKAYIKTGTKATEVEVEADPALPESADGMNGTPGPDYNITFNIPTFNGNKESSKIKFKVWAPGAGFEITHIYWAWEEQTYKKDSETRKVKNAVLDPVTGEEIEPAEYNTEIVWKPQGGIRKCSEELKLKVIKPAAEAGSTDFICYDSQGPIAARFSTNPAEVSFAETGATSVNFALEVLDTNPYFKETFNTSIKGVTLNQNPSNLGVEICYNYPVYVYTPESNKSMTNLKDGFGLADLENLTNKSAIFKTYKFEPKWLWKKAEVSSVTVVKSDQKAGHSGKLAGSISTLYGTLTVKQPKPWHFANATSVPTPVFRLMAVSKDTQGNPCPNYASIADMGESKEASSADPAGVSSNMAFEPESGTDIPSGPMFDLIADLGIFAPGPITHWSNQAFMQSTDTNAPEIQVVVFDTRTNRYHMFGTKEGVDGGFTDFAGNDNKNKEDYAGVDVPYLGKEGTITGKHVFATFGDKTKLNELFDNYLKGAGAGKNEAISTVADGSSNGFVCQKNNRLVFYIRAFDNINTCDSSQNSGITALSYTITDKDGTTPSVDLTNKMMEAQEHVFRFENVKTDGSVDPAYSLDVTAVDQAGKERKLKLAIAVMGRTLEIRTLEERRKRAE